MPPPVFWCPLMEAMLNRAGIRLPLPRDLLVVRRTVEIDHCRHPRRRSLVRGRVVHEKCAGRFTREDDLRRVDLVGARVGLDPRDGGVHILPRVGEPELRRHAVVDAEPGKPGVRQRLKRGDMFVARLPPSNPPPCTRIAAGNGPGPSGTCRSSSSACPPGRPYSTPFWSAGTAAPRTRANNATIRLFMALNCIRSVDI